MLADGTSGLVSWLTSKKARSTRMAPSQYVSVDDWAFNNI